MLTVLPIAHHHIMRRDFRAFAIILAFFLGVSCGAQVSLANRNVMSDHELIVLIAPTSDDTYYEGVKDEIFQFHIAFAEKIAAAGDTFLILADEAAAPKYDFELSELAHEAGYVVVAPVSDIWARDFSPANAAAPIRFRYTAAGQAGSQSEADHVQQELTRILWMAGVPFATSMLKNDGGNVVDDGQGHAVISKKFLRDNHLDEDEARAKLAAATGINEVAFIESDEQGGLEHSDGVVAFLEPNVLIVNSYEDDPDYENTLHADIKAGLPDVAIHKIVNAYDDSEVFDEKFGSACGLYTNALVTPNRIYLPQFGIPEDQIALEQVKALTWKDVVPVQSGKVCNMGGGVRCMSYQLRGSGAKALLEWADSKQ